MSDAAQGTTVTGIEATEPVAGSRSALTVAALAALLRARFEGDGVLEIRRVEMMDRAGPNDLVIIGSPKYAAAFATSKAGAALVAEGVALAPESRQDRALIYVADLESATMTVLTLVRDKAGGPSRPPVGIHATAIVDPTARLGRDVAVGAGCIIGPGAVLDDGVVLWPGVQVGASVRIGRKTEVHPRAVILERCTIGQRCVIFAGVVIGADGFGYQPAADGRGLAHIPHVGTVEIGDDVDIGANTCIDRAKFGATTIGSGTKIDNLVQIGHNCRIGRSCILCGQVGLAGSVVLGDGVVLGGAVGIADHLTLGDRAQVAARSGVMNDIPAGETWVGLPAAPAGESMRNYAAFRKLAEMAQRLRKCEKQVGAAASRENPA